jgi:hypothetical protein
VSTQWILAAFVLHLKQSFRQVATNSGTRLSVALTLILCAGAAGIIAHRGGGVDAAPQHVSAQSAGQHSPSIASPAASAFSFGSRITAAIKVAEAAPHGDIGTAAVATRP